MAGRIILLFTAAICIVAIFCSYAQAEDTPKETQASSDSALKLVIDSITRKDKGLQIECSIVLPESAKNDITICTEVSATEAESSTTFRSSNSNRTTMQSQTQSTTKIRRASCDIITTYRHGNQTTSTTYNVVLPALEKTLKPGESVNIAIPTLHRSLRKSFFKKDQCEFHNMPDLVEVKIIFPSPSNEAPKSGANFYGTLTASKQPKNSNKKPRTDKRGDL